MCLNAHELIIQNWTLGGGSRGNRKERRHEGENKTT
jgi:hypothetical protein